MLFQIEPLKIVIFKWISAAQLVHVLHAFIISEHSWILGKYFNFFMSASNLLFPILLSLLSFQMARLNEGLSLFDAILIVPMFQIVWTFFSICTGFVYFQEYQVGVHPHLFFSSSENMYD